MRGRKKNADTRTAILRCAAEIFSQKPFHEVLTDEISSRLKMGKGTLYRYFASKEELYFATIVEGLQGMNDAVDETLRREAPLEHTIEALTRTILEYFWERRDFFILLYRHEGKLDPSERAEWAKGREAMVARVGARLMDELGDQRLDPRLAVEMLFGMIRSVCLYRDQAAQLGELARMVTRDFLDGIRAPAGRRTVRPAAVVDRRRAAAGVRR
jgi:AcrR family transcriptional regulator